LQQQFQRLRQAGRNAAAARKNLATKQQAWLSAQRQAEAEGQRRLEEFTAARQETRDLQAALPDLELRAQAACERLAQARQQLRDHLSELHDYARQSQEDLESLRAQVSAGAEQIQQQRQTLLRAREEHRVAVAGFRQQIVEWQGQVADMKRVLANDGTRLERRQAAVEEQARQIDVDSSRLAQQAEELEAQERVVTERRQEMERHLQEMREWYRRKLRELSEKRHVEEKQSEVSSPEILVLAEEIDPADRKLGDLLRSLELVEAATLEALLREAQRQRRTLRQLLLAGGYLTLFQMALIETGNLDGLAMGPLRVIDRLRATARETVYRVFDSRRGQEAVLRHLAEAEMEDAVHPDEFRQRFQQAAAVQNAHIAGTLELLEIAGRPAVLQELVVGMPSTDWPNCVSVPAVWLRLLRQAARGLRAAHHAGIVHGHLQPEHLVLTEEGTLKIGGVGEPQWLGMPSVELGREPDVGTDLASLGRLVTGWAERMPRRKTAKTRAIPESVQDLLTRLNAETPENRYPDMATLLEELERAMADLPADAESWEILLQSVRDRDVEEELRESA
jgi:hypothetical protein